MNHTEERREAVIWIGEHMVLDAVRALLGVPGVQSHGRITSPSLDLSQLKVLRTTHDFSRRAIGFLVSHPDLPPVPEMCPAPDLRLEFVEEPEPLLSVSNTFIPMTTEEGKALMEALAGGGIIKGPRVPVRYVLPSGDGPHVIEERT